MKRSRITRTSVAIAFLLVSGSAAAYLAGGHFYTLWALHALAVKDHLIGPQDSYWKVEAFCAELPDLSRELDAVTQRERVLWSVSLREIGGWGWTGSCYSPISKHMVASQYYVHGLTGAKKRDVRSAAMDLITQLDPNAAANLSDQEKTNLACARGFALHLYGDSFAHAEFGKDKPAANGEPAEDGSGGTLYQTGLGHARVFSEPDFLIAPKHYQLDRWDRWSAAVAMTLFKSEVPANALMKLPSARASGTPSPDQELGMDSRLLAEAGATLSPEVRTIIDKVDKNLLHMVTPKCQDQVAAAARAGITGPAHTSPDCDAVWKQYVAAARVEFRLQGLAMTPGRAPDPGCDDLSDELSWGRQ